MVDKGTYKPHDHSVPVPIMYNSVFFILHQFTIRIQLNSVHQSSELFFAGDPPCRERVAAVLDESPPIPRHDGPYVVVLGIIALVHQVRLRVGVVVASLVVGWFPSMQPRGSYRGEIRNKRGSTSINKPRD